MVNPLHIPEFEVLIAEVLLGNKATKKPKFGDLPPDNKSKLWKLGSYKENYGYQLHN